MKKITFLFAIACLFLLNSCGVQWMITGGVGGQTGGQYPQQYPQQQPYYYSPGPYGPVDPVFLSPGQHRCPQP